MGFWSTWKDIMFSPTEFFANLPEFKGYKGPTKFYLLVVVILLAILAILLAIGMALFGAALGDLFGVALPASIGLGLGILLLFVIIIPLMVLLSWASLYINSGIMHLFVMLWGGKGGYKETFRVTSYVAAPSIFAFIPLISSIAGIYSLVLQVIGLKILHKVSTGRAIGMILTPLGIFLVIYFILLAVLL